jgi:hypothetical protein
MRACGVTVDRSALVRIAEECVSLVQTDFAVTLDWTAGTLDALDGVCAQLTEDGPLAGERLELWWQLLGAYLGEVVIRTYGGEWVTHEKAGGAYAVSVMGVHGFPFSTVQRVLQGEPFKSLASFARSLPAIAERSRADGPTG